MWMCIIRLICGIKYHDGTPLRVGEIRGVKVRRIWKDGQKVLSDECRAFLKKAYYITKREAVNSGLKYHFIATQNAPVKKLSSGEKDPSVPPGDPSVSVPGNPNEFQSQIAEIFCDLSMVQGLRNIRNENFQDCGVEQLLVQLCFEDPDVNGARTRVNFERVFNTEHDVNADQRRELAENLCVRFVGVKMPSKRNRIGGIEQTSIDKMMDHYFRGAWKVGFTEVFVRTNVNDCNAFTWEILPDYKESDKEYLKHILQHDRTQGIWYFCQP